MVTVTRQSGKAAFVVLQVPAYFHYFIPMLRKNEDR